MTIFLFFVTFYKPRVCKPQADNHWYLALQLPHFVICTVLAVSQYKYETLLEEGHLTG